MLVNPGDQSTSELDASIVAAEARVDANDLVRSDRQARWNHRYRIAAFISRHVVVIVCIIGVIAAGGLAYALKASHEAQQVQHANARIVAANSATIAKLQKVVDDQAALQKVVATQLTDRIASDANLLCGGFVPLSHFPLTAAKSDVGVQLIAWAKRSAVLLDCPGH